MATKPRKRHENKRKEVRVPAFGAFLKTCRLRSRKRPPSVEAVAGALRDLAIRVNHATLRGYEYGWVDSPDPVVLVGLAKIYKVDHKCLVAVLAANRNQRDLSELDVERILRTVKQDTHAEAEATTRLAEIRERLADIGGEILKLVGEQAPATRLAEFERAENDRESRR